MEQQKPLRTCHSSRKNTVFTRNTTPNKTMHILNRLPNRQHTSSFNLKNVELEKIVKCIIGPAVSPPYQRSLLQILLIVMELGDLYLIIQVFYIFYQGALLYRNFNEATYWVNQAKIVANFSTNMLFTTRVHIWASEIQKQRGDFDEALWNLQKALSCAYKYEQEEKQVEIYGKIAKIYYYMGALEEARKFHNKAMLFDPQQQDDSLRTASMKSHFFQPVLNSRVGRFNSEILNQMWLPINTSYIEHYQESRNRESMSLLKKVTELRTNIHKYYDLKNGILLVNNLKTENPVPAIQISGYGSASRLNDKILISHKTRNKNIELFSTDQSIIPKINKLIHAFEQKLRSRLSQKAGFV